MISSSFFQFSNHRGKEAHILRIGEISTILYKSGAYIAHWVKNLVQIFCIYCMLTPSNVQHAHLAQNTISHAIYVDHLFHKG